MEPKRSSVSLQKPATCLCPLPDQTVHAGLMVNETFPFILNITLCCGPLTLAFLLFSIKFKLCPFKKLIFPNNAARKTKEGICTSGIKACNCGTNKALGESGTHGVTEQKGQVSTLYSITDKA